MRFGIEIRSSTKSTSPCFTIAMQMVSAICKVTSVGSLRSTRLASALATGVLEKLDYMQKNHIRSILVQASIFNMSNEVFEASNRQFVKLRRTNLRTLDPRMGTEADFDRFIRETHSRSPARMHVILDLPLSSTSDHKERSWYGMNESPDSTIVEVRDGARCARDSKDLGCEYAASYQRLPLDFSRKDVVDAAEVTRDGRMTGAGNMPRFLVSPSLLARRQTCRRRSR